MLRVRNTASPEYLRSHARRRSSRHGQKNGLGELGSRVTVPFCGSPIADTASTKLVPVCCDSSHVAGRSTQPSRASWISLVSSADPSSAGEEGAGAGGGPELVAPQAQSNQILT